MIHVPPVISLAPATCAIQRFEKSVRTGSHGVVIHCTSTIPHTGAYSVVHIIGDVAAETIFRVDPNARNARIKKKYLIQKWVKKKLHRSLPVYGKYLIKKRQNQDTQKNPSEVEGYISLDLINGLVFEKPFLLQKHGEILVTVFSDMFS